MLCPKHKVPLTNGYLDKSGHTYQVGTPGVAVTDLDEPIANKPMQNAVQGFINGQSDWQNPLICTISCDFPAAPVHLIPGEGANSITNWRLYDARGIRKWFSNHNTTPDTREVMEGTWHLRPDYAAQKLALSQLDEAPEARDIAYPRNLTVTPRALRPLNVALAPAQQPWVPFNHRRLLVLNGLLTTLSGVAGAGFATVAALISANGHVDCWPGYSAPQRAHYEWAAYAGVGSMAIASSLAGLSHWHRAAHHPPNPENMVTLPDEVAAEAPPVATMV